MEMKEKELAAEKERKEMREKELAAEKERMDLQKAELAQKERGLNFRAKAPGFPSAAVLLYSRVW